MDVQSGSLTSAQANTLFQAFQVNAGRNVRTPVIAGFGIQQKGLLTAVILPDASGGPTSVLAPAPTAQWMQQYQAALAQQKAAKAATTQPAATGQGGAGSGGPPVATSQPSTQPSYQGGRHGFTKGPVGDGLDSHHMPSDAAYGEGNDGPAIQMEPADHAQTASNGRMPGNGVFRARQQALIQQGRIGEAIQMDIDDIRSRFGSKYDQAINQMLQSLTPAERIGLRDTRP